MILSIPAGDSRPYIDKFLLYSTPAGRPFDTSRCYTFRAKNGEMNGIYSIEHFELVVAPDEALRQLRSGNYRELSQDQVLRLKGYIASTINRLRGYDQLQDYYFLRRSQEDTLSNRPQMFPNSTITKSYSREDLIRGGRL